MNNREALERTLRATLNDTARGSAPDDLYERVMASTYAIRQRPWWLVRTSSPRWSGTIPRRWALIALVGIMLIGAVLAYGLAASPRPPVVAGVLAIADASGLVIAGADGAPTSVLLSEGPAFDPRWSPDGSSVAVLIGDAALRTLVVVGPDGTERGRTAGVKEYAWLGALLLVRRSDNRLDVLQQDLRPDHGALPIEVIAGMDPGSPLYDQPLADILAIRRDHVSGATNAWGGSPQNRGAITFITFLLGHGSGRAATVTSGTDVRSMVWSPSESTLAFVNTTCDPAVASPCDGVLSTTGSNGGPIRAFDVRVSTASELRWDALGTRILAAEVATSGSRIVLVDVASGVVSRLTDGQSNEATPRWADADQRVVFLRQSSGGDDRWDAWIVGVDGSAPALLVSNVNGVDWRPRP